MPAFQEEPTTDVASPDSSVLITMLSTPSSEMSVSQESDSEFSFPLTNELNFSKVLDIPEEPTLKDILINSTGTTDLMNVTKVKLQVIAIDLCLQNLSLYTPNLTELILDGSVLSSLRDLGCDLKNLKILRVWHCGLTSLDGMFGLESLVELYAGSNRIEDLSPCAFLPDIKILDLRKNYIKDLNAVSFLIVCQKLEQINLEGNEDLTEIINYRWAIKSMLPNLKTLDDIDFQRERVREILQPVEVPAPTPAAPSSSLPKEHFLPEIQVTQRSCASSNVRRPSSIDGSAKYTVSFPPTVLSPRPSTTSPTASRGLVLPDIHQKPVHSGLRLEEIL